MTTAVISNIQEALRELGVTDATLTEEEKKSLDEKGYVIFPDLINPTWLKQLQDAFEALMVKEGQAAGKEVHQEKGARRLADLMNKGEVFDGCYTHPKVLAAVNYIIKGEFKVSAMNGRDALPGEGLQPLHEDWNDFKEDGTYREIGDPSYVAISLWMLDDFTETNGATRVVPGTHLMKAPRFYIDDPLAPHPDQILLTGKAGTVAVMNSHTWHGGTQNNTNDKRRVLHPYYCARDFEQQQNQKEYIRKSTYDRISPAARYLLDV